MSCATQVVAGFRQGSFRLTSRGAKSLYMRRCRCDASPMPAALLSNHRLFLFQGSAASRSFSLWPSSKTSSAPLPSPLPPPPPSSPSPSPERAVESSDLEVTSGNSATESTPSMATNSTDDQIALDTSINPDTMLASEPVADILQNIIPAPLQFGDFSALGLVSWTPAGLIRWSFEIINIASGLPWFWTIVAGSAFWRFVCVPFALKASRTAAILQPHQKDLAVLQEKVSQSTASRNPIALQKAHREMQEFYRKLGVSPFGGLAGLIQLPVTLGLFFAVKKMCDLPVEQLKYSGLAMFPDLTVTDPTLILPIAMTVAVNFQLLFGARDVAPKMRPMLYFFHFLTIPGFFVLKSIPVGLIVSILTTGLLTTAQTLILRVPAVRRALGIPPYVPPQGGHQSIFEQWKSLVSQNGDLKEKVAKARREAVKKRNTRQTSRRL